MSPVAAIVPAERNPLADGLAPAWASEWGEDRFGPFAAFEIAGVVQVMRWIPPGAFRMGSSEGEPGRWEDEGPQHRVTLTHGFWLAETPCVQALWTAVMGDNPSRFVSPDRPVEQVSWDDVQTFLARAEALQPGLGLRLPTEAQWEYACRAGTKSALYSGPIEILGDHNAPALDPIAWYGGNSGVGFELDTGYDSSDWSEKQYDHTRAGTHPVKRRATNPWGLFDMIGNVLEWCADGQRLYRTRPVTDPVRPAEVGAKRVLRGGSWSADAGDCRSASRSALDPGDRLVYIGFRCARVQG